MQSPLTPVAHMLQTNPAVIGSYVISLFPLTVKVGVFEGDCSQIDCDAVVVPHGNGDPFLGGSNEIWRGKQQFRDYVEYVRDLRGRQKCNDVFMRRGNGYQDLLHVVYGNYETRSDGYHISVSIERIQKALFAALVMAGANSYTRVLLPSLVDNKIDGLPAEMAAEAIFYSIKDFLRRFSQNNPSEILVGIHRKADAEKGSTSQESALSTEFEIYKAEVEKQWPSYPTRSQWLHTSLTRAKRRSV